MGRITETIRCMVRLTDSAILEVAIRWSSAFSRLTDALKAESKHQTIEQPKRASGRTFASVVSRKRPSLNHADASKCEMSRLGRVPPSAGRDVIDGRACFLSLLARAAVWLLELRVSRTFLDQLRPRFSGHGYPTQRAAKASSPRSDVLRRWSQATGPCDGTTARRCLCLRTGSGITEARPDPRALPPPRITWAKWTTRVYFVPQSKWPLPRF